MKNKVCKILIVLFLITILPIFSQQKKLSKPSSPGSKILSAFKYPSISWKVPEAGKDMERLVLPNGMIVYMLEDHALPVVTVEAVIRTGEIYENHNKHGIARLTGEVMRTGGTINHSPEEFDKELEYMDAKISSSFGMESGSVSLKVLSKYLSNGLNLFSEMLRFPAFNKDKLVLAQSDIKEEILRRNDDPGNIVKREFFKKIYRDHPYGWEYEWPVVSSIARDDLIQWHKTYINPNNIFLAVSGDFKKDEFLIQLRSLFADWPKNEIKFPPVPPVKEMPHPGVFIVPKEQNQTYVQIGHLGINKYNPDRYIIEVMNDILGGFSPNPRLWTRVRIEEGLAYSVGSRFRMPKAQGVFVSFCQTKVETTHKAVSLILNEISQMRSMKVSDTELKLAKDAIINNFLFEFTNPHAIVKKLAMLEYDGMPKNFYATYRDMIQKVTEEDILRAAHKFLRPSEFTILLVGDPKSFDKSPESFGKVEVVPLELNK